MVPTGEAWISDFEPSLPVDVDRDNRESMSGELQQGESVDGKWFIVLILVYHLRQDIGHGVEESRLDRDRSQRELRHPDTAEQG